MEVKNNFDTNKLKYALAEIWESRHFPIRFKTGLDMPEKTVRIKICTNMFNKYGWTKSPEVIAETLTTSLVDLYKDRWELFEDPTLYETEESLASDLFPEDFAFEADKRVTAYYAGHAELNPPSVHAYLVIRMKSPSSEKFSREIFIDADEERVKVMSK